MVGRGSRSASGIPSTPSVYNPGEGSARSGTTSRDGVVERVMKEMGGSIVSPMLTRTNYSDWCLLMRVNLQSQGLWEAIETGDADYRIDRLALATILRSVPQEMLATLAVKETTKLAWEAIRIMCMGAERVREARAQTLRSEFETIRFKDGETVDDFAMRLTGLVNNLNILGDKIDDERVVRKFLRVVPSKYSQVAISIETLVDLKTLSIEELTGRLKVVEERLDREGDVSSSEGRLLLTEEEWLSRQKRREQANGFSNNKGNGRGNFQRRSKQPGCKNNHHNTKETWVPTTTRDMTKVKCFNCNNFGYCAKECRKPQKEAVNLTQEETPALWLAKHCELAEGGEVSQRNLSFNVKDAGTVDVGSKTWYLDTGASNHMTGNKDAFTSLDENVKGNVKFGDGSTIDIRGKGAVMFQCQNKEHRLLTEVYYIPRLRSNIISLGQLEEGGCKIVIEEGKLSI